MFKAELNELLTRELAEDGYSGVTVRRTTARTDIIIRATRTQKVLGARHGSATSAEARNTAFACKLDGPQQSPHLCSCCLKLSGWTAIHSIGLQWPAQRSTVTQWAMRLTRAPCAYFAT